MRIKQYIFHVCFPVFIAVFAGRKHSLWLRPNEMLSTFYSTALDKNRTMSSIVEQWVDKRSRHSFDSVLDFVVALTSCFCSVSLV